MKTVIIGGVAGGMSAATRLRRLDENAEIVVLERSGYVSFANCGLPYYVGDVITDRKALLLQTPTSLHARFSIDVRVDSEVVSIDRAAKSVEVRNLAGPQGSGFQRVHPGTRLRGS
jgi:NADPH-dependent 2,4-dienoyl-CoA reductase/sulfur reductase-like enzyme